MLKHQYTSSYIHREQSAFDFEFSASIHSERNERETELPCHAPAETMRRRLGAYYTPCSAADYMADWIVRADEDHILEPSFGDGIFLRAVADSAQRKQFTAVHISGVEINPQAQEQAMFHGQMARTDVRCEDFLGVTPFQVQAVIGNPPYVRLRQLADDAQRRALQAAKAAMGKEMDPSGSLWMPFVLHAMRFLAAQGRLALVLPYEFTYVRYARPLWNVLRNNFASLRVLRTHERLFPDLLQDVVILLADDYGSPADAVRYQAFERVQDLLDGQPVVDESLAINALLRGERVFMGALLGGSLRHLLETRVAEASVPARQRVTFNIGYVAGDKSFFHPTESQIQQYDLPAASLPSTLTSGRSMKKAGLRTGAQTNLCADKLFLPTPADLSEGERTYIAAGEAQGVSTRYKCRVRDPWFVVPGVRVPDVVLSVFSECPVLMLNDARYHASNSLLCGYCDEGRGEEIATAWYTSLTLLQCELEVHALGGGVMVMVPREAGNIRLPKHVRPCKQHLNYLDTLLRAGKTREAYRCGDEEVLIKQLGFTVDNIALIRHGIDALAHWRTSARSSLSPKLPEPPRDIYAD